MSKKSSTAVRVKFEPSRFAAEELSKIYESLAPFNVREFRPDVDAVRPIKKTSQSKRRNNGK